MEKQSVKKNYIYNTLLSVIQLIVPLITAPYVARVLGADGIGQYSYAKAMVSYFVLVATFGSSTFGQRQIAFSRDNKEKLNEDFWNVFCFRLILAFVSMLVYLAYAVNAKQPLLALIFSISIFNVAIDITWFFQGIELFKKIAIRNLLIRLISLISIFLFVRHEGDLWIYCMIVCLEATLGNLIMWGQLKGKVGKPRVLDPFSVCKESFLVFLPTIATQVYVVLDKSMIGWITNSDYANGCYEQSEKIARIIISVIISIGTVILPRVANLYKNGDVEAAKKYIYKAYRLVWFMAIPIVFGLISVAEYFIPLYFGPGYDAAIGLLQIFSLLVVFVSLAYVTGMSWLVSTNQQNIYTISVTFAAILNFGLNIILIGKLSAYGAAIASVSSEFLGVVIQIIYCVRTKQLEAHKIFTGTGRYLIASAVMYIIVVFIRCVLPISIINLLLLMGIGSCVYILMLILLRDDFVHTCINTIAGKYKKKS